MMKITRQGYYKNRAAATKEQQIEELIIQLVKNFRKKLPRIGGRKLYKLLEEDLRKLPIKTGRDKFFDILRENGLLVEPIKQYVHTTNSHHRFRIYSNLIKGLNIERSNQLWVADITYIRLEGGFCYLFLITDVYSRKIVGYHLSKSLTIDGAVQAVKKAIKDITVEGLIHHSDRGFQYCSDSYVKIINRAGIKISMGEAGNPYDNAIAERVNGILKTEFYLNQTFTNYQVAIKAVEEAISMYNELRPHMSIDFKTPTEKYAA